MLLLEVSIFDLKGDGEHEEYHTVTSVHKSSVWQDCIWFLIKCL